MKDPKTEQFLNRGGWKWEYVERIEFSEIDMTASKENPSRILRRVDEERALNYGIAMEAGNEFPAIVVLTIIPREDDNDDEIAEGNQVSVSLLITQAQKTALHKLGYTDAQIREMSPAEAHKHLGVHTPLASGPAFKYLIATGVHRVEGAISAHLDHFDAYIVTEPDAYRQEVLTRQLNTIEGQGVSISDRVLQVLLLHQTYPDHSLRKLAKEWHLSYSTVKSAQTEKQAARRAQRFGFEFSKGNKLSQRCLLALNTIHSDPVFAKALHFALNNNATAAEIDDIVKEIKQTRDDAAGLAIVEHHNQMAAAVKEKAEAKHGRISPAPSTKFLGDAKRLNNQLDKGIDHMHFSAYPRLDHASILLEDLIANLTKVANEVRRLRRIEDAAKHAA